MAVYLHDIPLDEAKEKFYSGLTEYGLRGILNKEIIPINEHAVGRILAETVWAKISSPHYHASAMDGFAVKAKDSYEAMQTNPINLVIGEQTEYVDTGDPMPDWSNAVIPIEKTEPLDEFGNLSNNPRSPYKIRIRDAVVPWSNVRPMGEDIVASELVIPSGKKLTPFDLGAAAACGHTKLIVSKKPHVIILPTGTELVSIGEKINTGDIIEYNSVVLGSQIIEWGGDVTRFPITIDDFEKIKNKVSEAAVEADLILLNAGSSAGSEDYSALVIEQLGEVYVHGIAVRPGHPVIIGMVKNKFARSVPIIGVPGYPVSAALTNEIFVHPLINEWLGKIQEDVSIVDAKLTKKINSPAGDDDYVRMVVGKVEDQYVAAPLTRGAGVITSLVKADGYSIIPRGIQGISSGDKISIHLIKNHHEIENTIFVIGSHDMTLDLLAEYLAKQKRRLVSSNVGSLGGLMAINRGESHLCGTHLLDPETGLYNSSYVNKYVKNFPVRMITWLSREQGFILPKQNPKKIYSFEDLTNPDILFVNRQRGSGTRVLFDFLLEQNNIDKGTINGYDQEEYTHLSVAAAIASERADVGLGIFAAAQALDLNFIPLIKERYDFVIPEKFFGEALIQPVLDLMHDNDFKKHVQTLPGYDPSLMGIEVIESENRGN